MGMQSNFAVQALLTFLIAFYLPNAFAQRRPELCGSNVCTGSQMCGVVNDGTYQCVPRKSVSPSVPKSSPVSSVGKPPTTSTSKRKRPSPKNGRNSTPDSSDNNDGFVLGDEPNASGGGFCDYSDDTCKKGYHCQKQVCVKDANTNDSAPMAACEQQYESLMRQCRKQINETARSCDEKNDSGMNSVMSGALQMGRDTASSIQKSCSDTAALMQGANAALAAYRMNCSSAISDCNSVCSQVKAFAIENNSCMSGIDVVSSDTDLTVRADDAAVQCNSFDSKVNEANQAMQNFTQTLGNAANCRAETAGNPSLAGLPQFCQIQPNYPGCNPAAPVDCRRPDIAASNKVCICSRNPMDPGCSVAQKAGVGTGFGPNINASGRLNKSASDEFGGDLPDLPLAEHRNINTDTGKPIDGHQGGNAALGGGDSGAGGGPSGSGGTSSGGSDGQASSSGFYGGGGNGMYGSAGGGSYGREGTGRYAAGTGGPGRTNSPDLRKFLPGGQFDPKRGISGMSGPDGITGPHSDIWQKVQNRYRVMRPSLLP